MVRRYNNYDMEVIDRMGADSFTPDSGVMISKTKNSDDESPFQWTIDANPQDINVIDFYRPNGTASYLSIGDYRQLADALFHAGTKSGSEFEYVDEANGLHFYVLDVHRNGDGVLSYDVGVRSLNSANSGDYGVELSTGTAITKKKGVVCSFKLTNSGSASGEVADGLEDFSGSDIYRLSAEVKGKGWEVNLANELAFAEFGKSIKVKAGVIGSEGCSSKAVVTLVATSESNRSKSARATCKVTSN